MCKRCNVLLTKKDSNKNDIPCEDLYYDEIDKCFYLITQQCMYERQRIKVNHCPWCGDMLNIEDYK